jgi:hypothetical protein
MASGGSYGWLAGVVPVGMPVLSPARQAEPVPQIDATGINSTRRMPAGHRSTRWRPLPPGKRSSALSVVRGS